MRLPLYQVDAFAARRFAGNPAAICPLPHWLPDATLQAIAIENNLAETAYFVKEPAGYRIRWFTPGMEVDLCGHATLAAGFVLMRCLGYPEKQVTFQSRSGPLTVSRFDDLYTLDFPSRPPQPIDFDEELAAALGGTRPLQMLKARDAFVVYASEAQVRALAPNMAALKQLPHFGIIATAAGDEADFVSRFFAPAAGVDEDPVTGSAHCTLTPYWAGQLGKKSLFGRQISPRGGELWVIDNGERVDISGRCALYLTGFIELD